jgi:ABC-type multidrug transport system fused ATPase/permease subunit
MTTIIVAHRLSTIERCDKIFVFNKGRIVEEGRYQDLLGLRGYFYKLANGLS